MRTLFTTLCMLMLSWMASAEQPITRLDVFGLYNGCQPMSRVWIAPFGDAPYWFDNETLRYEVISKLLEYNLYDEHSAGDEWLAQHGLGVTVNNRGPVAYVEVTYYKALRDVLSGISINAAAYSMTISPFAHGGHITLINAHALDAVEMFIQEFLRVNHDSCKLQQDIGVTGRSK